MPSPTTSSREGGVKPLDLFGMEEDLKGGAVKAFYRGHSKFLQGGSKGGGMDYAHKAISAKKQAPSGESRKGIRYRSKKKKN